VTSGKGGGQNPVCVLGFGRSGTSLTMRLLNLLGVDVGPEADLLPAQDADNPRGYWEPRWMIDLNDEILAALGTPWQRPFDVEPGWEQRPELDPLRKRARELIEEKFGSAPLWGWKDPRTMLTLPFWRDLVPDVRYVFCLRNPADVISSFQRRPEANLPIQTWGDLWMEYTARALQETREQPRLLVFYEDLFRDGAEQIARIASFLHIDAPAHDTPGWAALLEEIKPDLRHHSTSSLELAGAWGIAPMARAFFLALRAAHDARQVGPASDGCDGRVSDAVERIAPEMWSERRLLADAQRMRGEAEGQIAGLHQEREQLRSELAQEREQLRAEHSQEREQLRAELSQAHTEQSQLSEELRQTREALTLASTQCHEAQAELATLQERFARQQAVVDGLQSSVSWRITTPLRGAKRLLRWRRGHAARHPSVTQR
jgi:hypothetical protein